ncbi:MAG: response regulator transcription factor [Candidatus Saccharibacteria bacterium]|nr:response regulator transcription factor [Candidatus Saccharibacteria bacterium]
MRLLIVEDDPGIVLVLYRALATLYTVDTVGTSARAMQKLTEHPYDAIILDLNLPDSPGLKICERVRTSGLTTPILVLSGATEVMNKVTLLDSGANDYLTKPFSMDELKARLRVLTRRPGSSSKSRHRLVVGDLELDTIKHLVQRAGQNIPLRRKEFAVLECLMQNTGMVVTRATLSSYAWDDTDDSLTNTVDVHIKYLRDKIDRPFGTPLIKTVHGLGYKIDAFKSSST